MLMFSLLGFLYPLRTRAQETPSAPENMKAKTDTVLIKTPKHSPKKATLLSAFLPGAGQIYNKKYWKVPILYGGFAALIYSYVFYLDQYNIYREAYKKKNSNQTIDDPQIAQLPAEMIYNIRESYRESRDLSMIALVGLYALNVIDAAVDAHLYAFDVSENLSLRVEPSFQYTGRSNFTMLSLKLNFKK
jgi:hypothetical protein